MKKLLLYLLLLIWGAVGKPAYAVEVSGTWGNVPHVLVMRQCDDIPLSRGGCVYDSNNDFRGVVAFRVQLTPAQQKARVEAARKAEEQRMEKMRTMIREEMARTNVASWTPAPLIPAPSVGSALAAPSPTPAPAPTPAGEASSEAASRIAELEAQVARLQKENGRLKAEAVRFKSQPATVVMGSMEAPVWLKWLTILNSVVLLVILIIAAWGAAWVLSCIAWMRARREMLNAWWIRSKAEPRMHWWQLWKVKQEKEKPAHRDGSLGLHDRPVEDERVANAPIHHSAEPSST